MPSGDQASAETGLVCPVSVLTGVPSLFQRRTLKSVEEKSPELLANNLPSGDQASAVTGPVWPDNIIEGTFEAAVGVGAVVDAAVVGLTAPAVGLGAIMVEAAVVGLAVMAGTDSGVKVDETASEGLIFAIVLATVAVLSPQLASKLIMTSSNGQITKNLPDLPI